MATITDLNLEARDLVSADTTSFTAASLLRKMNQKYEEIMGDLISLGGTWQIDDSNYTDLPIATTTLVADQFDYSFAGDVLSVEQVQIKDSSGRWSILTPLDLRDQTLPLDEQFPTSGLPTHYDKRYNSIFVFPAPAAANVTLTAGLRVYFKRTADLFTSAQVTTGTKTPGFASPWHYILAYGAAIPYAAKFKQELLPFLMSEYARMKKELIDHYQRREADVHKRLEMNGTDSR